MVDIIFLLMGSRFALSKSSLDQVKSIGIVYSGYKVTGWSFSFSQSPHESYCLDLSCTR